MLTNAYYNDPTYQLDVNLVKKQIELMRMLEQFEQQQCLVCFKLKCCCAGVGQTPTVNKTPEKVVKEEIQAWMMASKLREKSEIEKKIQQVKKNLMKNNACSGPAVDAFFRYYKMTPNTSVTELTNTLAKAFTQVKMQKQGYSYF